MSQYKDRKKEGREGTDGLMGKKCNNRQMAVIAESFWIPFIFFCRIFYSHFLK